MTKLRNLFFWLTAMVVCAPSLVWAQEQPADSAEPAATGQEGPLPEWEQFVEGILEMDLFDIPLWRVGLSLLVLLVGFSLRSYLLDKLLAPLKSLFERTETTVDERLLTAVRSPLGWVLNLVAIYFALVLVEPPASLMTVISLILQTIGTVLVAWVIYKILDVGMHVMSDFAHETESEMDDQLVPVARRVLRVVLFIIVAIAIIQQWGYDVTSLIAGLGIGGLAFALAAKPTLSNWFGSIMIFTDRPFQVGDWVKTGVGEGIVEEVGLRSTRIRTFTQTLITVPNADIATMAVENMSAMPKRRIRTHIGLLYSTNREQMDQILEGIRELLRTHEKVEDDTWLVHFDEFGDSALKVLLQCWIETTAYDEFLVIKQELFLDIMAIVEEAGSGFAFPSQSLYVENPVRTLGGG